MIRTAALLVALVLGSTVGCSGAPDRVAPSVVRPIEATAEHNETDLAYVDRMGSQHQQAVDMVAMIANKDVSPELRALAEQIGEDRTDEITTLRRLARVWKVPPHPSEFHGNPGELTMGQLSELYGLDGVAFEARWTEQIVDNSLGAVAMSKAEVDTGLNLGTRELARELVKLLEDQIEQLETLRQ